MHKFASIGLFLFHKNILVSQKERGKSAQKMNTIIKVANDDGANVRISSATRRSIDPNNLCWLIFPNNSLSIFQKLWICWSRIPSSYYDYNYLAQTHGAGLFRMEHCIQWHSDAVTYLRETGETGQVESNVPVPLPLSIGLRQVHTLAALCQLLSYLCESVS